MKIVFIILGVVSVLGFCWFVFAKWSKKKSQKNQDLLDGDMVGLAYEVAEAGWDVAVEAIPAIIEKTSEHAAPVGEAIVEVISSIDV